MEGRTVLVRIIKLLLLATGNISGGHIATAQTQADFPLYYFDSIATVFHAVRNLDDGILIIGQHGVDTSGISSMFVFKVDTFGQILNLKTISDPRKADHTFVNNYYYDGVLVGYNNRILISGVMLRSDDLIIVELNEHFDIDTFIQYLSDVQWRSVKQILPLDNNYYITGMLHKPDNELDVFVQKTDLQLNIIWERTYGNPEYSDNGGSAVVEDGGLTLLEGEWTDPSHLEYNDERRWTKFIHIDTSGSIQWQWKSEENEEAGSPNGLVKSGSNYLYFTSPAHQESPAEIHFGTQIVCRDSTLNLVWKKEYSNLFAYQGFNDMVIGPDGYLYVTGQIYDEVMWGRIFKIDPANGDVVWQARDTGLWRENWGSRNVMEGITVLPSESVIAVGYTWAGQGFERGFVIKATKDGCVDTICTTSTIDAFLADQSKKVKVYPNPTTDYVIFDLLKEISDLHAEIFDMHGRRISNQFLRPGPNVMMLNVMPGIYAWLVVNKDGHLLESGKLIVVSE